MKRLQKYSFLILILPFLIVIQSCQVSSQGPSKLIIDSESIQLEWDPPAINENNSLHVVSYKVYYSIHGLENWILLDTITAEENQTYSMGKIYR